jgi:phage minor structural protein
MDMTPAAWESEKFTSGLGRLPDAREPRTHRAVNGDWSFSMKYPLKGVNVETLQQQRLICAEGQLYRINGIDKVDTLEGRMWQVSAEHIMYDLRDCDEITNIETVENPDTEGGVTQAAALGMILAGTPFLVGTVDNTETLDHLEVLQQGPFTPLKEQVLAKWGGELWPDNWTINILAQCGQDRRYPIRRGKNLKGITYKESTKETVTRLHVKGYEGATFEEINNGHDYIDSPHIGLYPHPKHGRVEFSDIDDPTELLAMANAHIPTVDVPQVNYEIDLLFLKNTVQWALYAPLEVYDLGDTSVIHHEFFSTDINARAMEVERDPVKETCTRVVLGNYKEDLYTALSDAKRSAEIVDSIVSRSGNLRGDKLRGTIDLLVTQLKASGAYANAAVLERQGFLLENTDAESADYGAMYIGPGILPLQTQRGWTIPGTGKRSAGLMVLWAG